MANNCYYQMKVVADDPEVIKRLHSIMNYEDPEYYIYRVFNCDMYDEGEEDGRYVATFSGDVAWSADAWVHDEPNDEADDDGRTYTNLVDLSGKLGFSCEIYTEECGCCFNEHYQIASGKLIVDVCIPWYELFYEQGDEDSFEEDIEYAKKCGLEERDICEIRKYVYDNIKKGYDVVIQYGGYEWNYSSADTIVNGYCASKPNKHWLED